MYRLRTNDGIFPLDDLKNYGEYLVHFYGGQLIKHTEKSISMKTAQEPDMVSEWRMRMLC